MSRGNQKSTTVYGHGRVICPLRRLVISDQSRDGYRASKELITQGQGLRLSLIFMVGDFSLNWSIKYAAKGRNL